VSPEVAEVLLRTRKALLEALGEETRRKVVVEPDPALPTGGWAIEAG
jgi:hypothetical protein